MFSLVGIKPRERIDRGCSIDPKWRYVGAVSIKDLHWLGNAHENLLNKQLYHLKKHRITIKLYFVALCGK